MSLFRSIFGGGKKAAATAEGPQDAIQKLRETEEMLIKKQEFLEKKIAAEVATARKHGTKNKRVALHALKRKKQFEKQLEHIDGVLNTLEYQKVALENASTNAEVLHVMKGATDALKSAHNNMDVDQVHDLMEEIADQQEVANEIAEAISSPAGFEQDVDEDELLKELEELEQEDLDKQLLNVGPAVSTLPEPPTTELPASAKKVASKKQQEDEDLAELEAWANV
uniref:Charged multivesicular body protein 4b n=1 Tax=Syphacia muris TaxID=451379 RepID=A0A0N5AHI2_9BILA